MNELKALGDRKSLPRQLILQNSFYTAVVKIPLKIPGSGSGS